MRESLDFAALIRHCACMPINSLNSSGSVDVDACARVAAALPAAAVASCAGTSPALRSSASVAHASVSSLHSNSWSDTARVKGPTGRRCTKGGVSGPAEDLLPVSEVEAGVNFRPAGGVRGQVADFSPREATRHWYQACQGRCGHTFPPPGGSWYPIRVTWIRIGHQVIDGLDEGVWNRTSRGFGC